MKSIQNLNVKARTLLPKIWLLKYWIRPYFNRAIFFQFFDILIYVTAFKKDYYNALFKDNRRNIKNMWKGININIYILNWPLTASHSRGTKPPCWRAKVPLGHGKQKTCIILNYIFWSIALYNHIFKRKQKYITMRI